ncbi:hypothetical protein NX794_21275 [Streptomyces sp. LP11]|uniref:Amidohydrolase n=1 Tax=Streptomyces pyxinicus TaxID=2970331 RepID=A0ABT2B5D3_9ACTN|nr:hypothetical protein [Streptomyces sp. LP11]MCS0603727.1 hypothetical protein [Streptomyces sp. LP11]
MSLASSSPGGPADADTFPAVCDHTHLFPGARPRVQGLPDPAAFAAEPRPVEVDLRFSDGVITNAELRTPEPGAVLLGVPAYTTAAGTPVDARTWLVREVSHVDDEVELRIGGLAVS